jgi:hypothetical protein
MIMFIDIFYCLFQMFKRLYLRFVIKDITFGYCLNLTFKNENEYYGLREMSLGIV